MTSQLPPSSGMHRRRLDCTYRYRPQMGPSRRSKRSVRSAAATALAIGYSPSGISFSSCGCIATRACRRCRCRRRRHDAHAAAYAHRSAAHRARVAVRVLHHLRGALALGLPLALALRRDGHCGQ